MVDANMDPSDNKSLKMERKKKKKAKKEKKRKRKETETTEPPDDDAPGENETLSLPMEHDKEDGSKNSNNDTEKVEKKSQRKKARLDKQKQQEEWMAKVPKVDADGIAYTKLQTRRMLKRVKRGLSPVPTEAEERERLRNEAQLRREEEAELAGMIYKRNEDDDDDDDDKAEEDDENENGQDDTKEKEESGDEAEKEKEEEAEAREHQEPTQPPVKEEIHPRKKKAKRSKPVPDDYVCSACQNKHTPAHWIYDCPDKITMKGTNQKKKKLRGLHDPDSKKVFVSGLPFDVKAKDIHGLFQSCGPIASHKLVTFKDTGRCNGQAYVSFETEAAATKALKISGTNIDGGISQGDKKSKKKKKADDSSKRKELKLKVSRVLNRRLTKGTTV